MPYFDPSALSQPVLVIVSLLLILLGILFTFFGYRLFRVVLGIAGFLFGASLVGGLVLMFSGSILAAVLAGLAGGALFAVLSVFVYYLGVFFLGAYLGVVVGAAILSIFGLTLIPWLFILLAVIGGVLGVIFHRFMIILATAFVGAWGVMLGISSLTFWGTSLYPYIMGAGWIILGLAGFFVQYFVTGKKRIPQRG